METLLRDLSHSVRQFSRAPLFVGTIVTTLALAIGANTLLFAVANAAFFRALPYPEASRLVSPSNVQKGRDVGRIDEPTARLAEAASPAFQSFALYNAVAATFLSSEYPERVPGTRVSEAFFRTLGVDPIRGRAFSADELRTGGPNVIILSDALWARRFGRDAATIGERIALDSGDYEVVGVMPPHFTFPVGSEFWLPLFPRQIPGGGVSFVDAVARMQPSVTIEQAKAALVTLRGAQRGELPKAALASEINLLALQERMYGRFTRPLTLLLGVVACVLLIGCVNVANLLLARVSTRRAEIAVRAALGASQWRLLRQLLAENLLLAGAGAAVGVVFALAGLRVFRAVGPAALVRLPALAIDGQVLLFTAALGIATGLLFGVVPALAAARVDPGERLKDNRGGSHEHSRPRRTLVALEIAIAVTLMLGAALLAKSFIRYQSVDRGFTAENVLTASLTLSRTRYPNEAARGAFFGSLIDRLRRLPDVESVSVSAIGLSGVSMTLPWPVPGRYGEAPEVGVAAGIGDRHFATFGIPLIEGRECAGQADASSVVINASMARDAYPGSSPVGRSMDLSAPGLGHRTIIGVAADVPNLETKRPPLPMALACAGGEPVADGTVAVRVREGTPALALAPALRRAVRAIDPLQPVTRVTTVEQDVRQGISSRWFDALVIAALAALAMFLALSGLFAVTAYSVAQRTREIGVRVALGADRASVMKLVLRQGGTLVGVGTVLGVLAAVPLVRFIRAMLFDVEPLDPAVFAIIAILVTAVAMLATILPARRASRVDPIVALRAE